MVQLILFILTINLKDLNRKIPTNISPSGRAQGYSNLTKNYGLCTLEKYFIVCHREMASLN